MEELFCIGCGAQIQTEDKEKAGYTPASSIKKAEETGELYCQRCFRLRHYNEIVDVHITDDEFLKLLHEVGDSDALVVNVVDIFDFNGSIIPGLLRFVSGNDVLLVGNKKDILPKSVKDGKVTQWLTERAHEEGMRPVDVMLTSAQNHHAIKELIQRIEKLRKGRDVYVVGVTNVGKSTLINAIIKEITGDKDIITTSRFPKLEGADALYDKHVGSLLMPPGPKDLADFPKLVRHEFTVKDKTDIVFSGLGWIRVQGKADQPTIVAAWAPEGVGVVVRKAII